MVSHRYVTYVSRVFCNSSTTLLKPALICSDGVCRAMQNSVVKKAFSWKASSVQTVFVPVIILQHMMLINWHIPLFLIQNVVNIYIYIFCTVNYTPKRAEIPIFEVESFSGFHFFWVMFSASFTAARHEDFT